MMKTSLMGYHGSFDEQLKSVEEHYNVKRRDQFEIGENDFITHHINRFAHPDMLIIPKINDLMIRDLRFYLYKHNNWF